MENGTKLIRDIIKSEIKLIDTKLTFKDPAFYSNKRNYIRIVCISDTHTHTDDLINIIPDGDVFIHAGDFSYSGQPREIEKFKSFLKSLPHPKKVFIAGNHDITFDKERYEGLKMRFKLKLPLDQIDIFKWFDESDNVIYLEDSSVELYGYKFYGSPYSLKYYNWAFMKSDDNLKVIWNKIPDETDILITHGPPLYI